MEVLSSLSEISIRILITLSHYMGSHSYMFVKYQFVSTVLVCFFEKMSIYTVFFITVCFLLVLLSGVEWSPLHQFVQDITVSKHAS